MEKTYGITIGGKRRRRSSRYLRPPFRFLKWILTTAVIVEVMSFIVITASNFILYGGPREGSRVRYDPYALFLNREGQRPTLHPPFAALGVETKTMWLFGGSTMRGDTDDHGKTIASFLAHMLNQDGNKLRWRIFNFGENSFNSLLEVKYLQKQLIENPSRPDLILFYDGANESVYLSQHRTPSGHYGYRRLTALVNSYDRSLFGLLKPLNAAIYASFTRELYDKIMQVMTPVREDRPLLEQFVKESERRYDHVHELAKAMGGRFLLVLQPIWWVETTDVPAEVKKQEETIANRARVFKNARENFSLVYDALSEGLRHKPYFVDFRDILSARSEPTYKADGVHLSDNGREMVAARLARLFQEIGILSGEPRG